MRGAGEFATDVSKQRVSPIFKGLAAQELDCVTLEDFFDTLSRNVDNKLSPYTAQYSRRERPQLNSGRSLKPRISASVWTLCNSFSIFFFLANVVRCVYFARFVKNNHRANKRNLKNVSYAILFYFSLKSLNKFICKLHCFIAVCQIRPKTFKVSTNPRRCPNCHTLSSLFNHTYGSIQRRKGNVRRLCVFSQMESKQCNISTAL